MLEHLGRKRFSLFSLSHPFFLLPSLFNGEHIFKYFNYLYRFKTYPQKCRMPRCTRIFFRASRSSEKGLNSFSVQNFMIPTRLLIDRWERDTWRKATSDLHNSFCLLIPVLFFIQIRTTQLVIQRVGQDLGVLAIAGVLLPVEEPVGDL